MSDHSSCSYSCDSPIEVEESPNTTEGVQERSRLGPSVGIYAGVTQVGGVLGIMPIQAMYQPSIQASSITHDSAFLEGHTVDHKYIKELILNQSNTAKIRPVLLSFGGIPESGKTKAVQHLLRNYVQPNPFEPLTKNNEKELGAEGITYYELVAAGFHPLRDLTITEVTKESSCAFGIMSAFQNGLLEKGQVPLFKVNPNQPNNFMNEELEDHLQQTFKYLYEYEHTPRGNEVTIVEQKYARRLYKLLPEGIALINIWDIAINKTVLHFMTALRGLLYNGYTWLFLDIDRDLEDLEKPPKISDATSRDWSVLMKWRPRIHYLLRHSRMNENKHSNRKNVCTIFAKHKSSANEDLKQKVTELEAKIQQTAKHIGVSSLIEPKIETIELNGHGIPDDYSLHLYQKFQRVIYNTPYDDIPLSWVFLRSLFYRSSNMFISKIELLRKAKECGIDEKSLAKFCEFYTSFGSIFDLSLVDPEYPYIIVKPMGFLKTLDKLLSPQSSVLQRYINGIVPAKVCQEALGKNWLAFMEALLSVNLAIRVSNSNLDVPNLDSNETHYFVPLSRKGNLIINADPTAVHLITSINTPHVFKQATFAKYLLQSLPEPKLVPCSNPNQMIIKECSTGTTITLVSHSPASKISVSKANSEICSLIVKAYNEIAETCSVGTTKYKFVVICAKSGVPNVQDIPFCWYHVLPNDTLCDECVNAERVNDQLKAWNEALRKYAIPSKCQPDRDLKSSELAYIAERITSCNPSIVAKKFGFKDLNQYQGMKGEKLFNALLLEWDRVNQLNTQIEIRQALARKLLELDALYNGPLEQKPDFEALAKEIDIHARL